MAIPTAPTTGPKTFADAVVQLKEINDQINVAMENDEPDSAHDPLHNVGNLLNKLPELATDTDLSESEWTEVKDETDRVFKAFGQVDAAFHDGGDKKAAYDSAKSTINEGITALEVKLAASGSKLSTYEHDHEGHDHEGHDHEEHDH